MSMETKIGTINGNSNTVAMGMMESAIENALASYEYEGSKVTFNRKDDNTVMVNATEMAKPFGKTCKDWLRTEQSQRIIAAISERRKCHSSDLLKVTYGDNGGTWMHEDVALIFAQWLSPEFYLWCNDHIKELLRTGSTSLDLPHDYLSALEALVAKEKERQRLASKVEQDKPKVIFADAVMEAEDCILIGQLAKTLAQNGIKNIGEIRLFTWMRANGYLCSSGKDHNLPMQRYVEQGLFRVKETTRTDPEGKTRINFTTTVTPKGQKYFINLFQNN